MGTYPVGISVAARAAWYPFKARLPGPGDHAVNDYIDTFLNSPFIDSAPAGSVFVILDITVG